MPTSFRRAQLPFGLVAQGGGKLLPCIGDIVGQQDTGTYQGGRYRAGQPAQAAYGVRQNSIVLCTCDFRAAEFSKQPRRGTTLADFAYRGGDFL